MDLQTIQGITTETIPGIIDKVKKKKRLIKFGDKNLTVEECLKQYDPNQHEVYDRTFRKDKPIEVPDPSDPDGKRTVPDLVYVNRSSEPAQKLIVTRANAFLTGKPIELLADTDGDTKKEEFLKIVKRVWTNNKLDFKNSAIGETLMSETHVAEIWYAVKEPGTDDYDGLAINAQDMVFRMKIISESRGDKLWPLFDNMKRMYGFVHGWTEVDEDDDQNIEHYDFYTPTNIIATSLKSGIYNVDPKVNLIEKTCVIYYSQPEPEWLIVQHNITRRETLRSNFGDTNDYYSSPTTVVKGEVIGMSKKGERGKLLEVEQEADVSLLQWDNASEAVALEDSMQKEIILTGTQTPDISFESMKGLGTFSGIALKMLFFDASLKVSSKAPTYAESIQRRINLIKAAIVKFDISFEDVRSLQITPKIEAYMPENEQERLEMLATATNAKPVMSRETAVTLNPFVKDPVEENKKLDAEDKALADAMVTEMP